MSRVEPNRNVYVGHRYVPKIFGEWDKKNEYEGLSIVTYQGASYTSKKRVPVGIDILNEEFWVITGNYNAQVDDYRQEVQSFNGRIKDNENKVTHLIDEMFEYNSVENEIYIDSNASYDGDGSKVLPYSKISDGFEHIKKLTDKGAEGKWIIRLSGTFNEGYRIIDMPNVRETIEIVGDTTVSGEPDTVLSGLDINDVSGLWFEPGGNLSVVIKNIIFKDYISYGVLMKDKGHLNINNCHFYNIDRGVGGISQNRTTVYNSYFENCQTGIVSEYSSTLTAGKDKNGNIFKECQYAVMIQRNSIAHVDYNDFIDSTLSAIQINESSRSNCTGNKFNGNNRGVTVMGGGEWINNDNEFLNSQEFDYQHFGTGKETRLYGQRTNVDYRMPLYKPLINDYTGNVENSLQNVATLPSIYQIPKDFFRGDGKKLKIIVYGLIEENPNNSESRITISTVKKSDGGSRATLGHTIVNGTYGSFIYEMESTNINGGGQFTKNQLLTSKNNTIIQLSNRNTPTSEERSLRVEYQCDDPEMLVKIMQIEFIQAG